jgi:hypothetical protein
VPDMKLQLDVRFYSYVEGTDAWCLLQMCKWQDACSLNDIVVDVGGFVV